MDLDLVQVGNRIAEETGHYSGGPPKHFELVGRYTLQTLLAAGLLPHHRLLDFGCGSLRNGYWLIRFLDSGRYYGLEPIEKGVRSGLKHLIGAELEAFKKPTFIFNRNSDMREFGVHFDFVMARSILSHACPGTVHKMFESFADSSPNGVMYASYWRHDLPALPPVPNTSTGAPISDKPWWRFWEPRDEPLNSSQAIAPELERYRGLEKRRDELPESRKFLVGDKLADDDTRFVPIITYSLATIQRIANQYGLHAEEDWTFAPINKQIWLRICKKP